MSFVIYNKETIKRYETSRGSVFSLERIAKSVFTKAKLNPEKWAIASMEEYDKLDIEVETTNILGKPGNVVMIRKSLLGTCCDPATERYHSM